MAETKKIQKIAKVAVVTKGHKIKNEMAEAKHGNNGHHAAEMVMTENATFAEMLRGNLKIRKLLKFPDWLFADTCNRKDQASLTPTEQQRFLCAYQMINANGTLGNLIQIHAEPHRMHHTLRFLPWHRVFLLALEEALHAVHPDVCLPYWDWTKESEHNVPSWLSSYLPTVVTPTSTINVVRAPHTPSDLGVIAANTPSALSSTNFTDFTNSLEGIHDGIHVWVGGSMGFISSAPADPLFWMHHCNIDRLWWKWYNSPQGTGKNPPLTGSDAIMDPYPALESDTRNIINMGFRYI